MGKYGFSAFIIHYNVRIIFLSSIWTGRMMNILCHGISFKCLNSSHIKNLSLRPDLVNRTMAVDLDILALDKCDLVRLNSASDTLCNCEQRTLISMQRFKPGIFSVWPPDSNEHRQRLISVMHQSINLFGIDLFWKFGCRTLCTRLTIGNKNMIFLKAL